jgi:predicted PurR-regulated permease PerM
MKKQTKNINVLSEYKDFIIKILIAILAIGILLFLYNIFKILIIIFFALFLNILFSPFLNKLNKYKIHDWLGIILIYLILIIFIIIVFFAIIPIFVKQTVLIASNISIWLN